ncbi:MAG TPA: oligosaccharide flippase family protein [Syntrophales bacterium]|nr:oligosaccharide flippase family protein [Syntrophales bacterium]HQN76930.1 oligosaccharide flippase family protein [Syntrophales bacterium]HQQ26937.1 oligosaccharide flippase family protein [Syntrophales bacterium]
MRLFSSEFVRNVLTLVTGNSIAQVIPLAAEPFLTRLFRPEEFGVLALFISISTLFAVVATGRYEMAIMLPLREEDAAPVFWVSVAASVLVALLSLLLMVWLNGPICRFLESPGLSPWLWFVPLVVLSYGVYQSLHYWAARQKKFLRISGSRVTQSLSNAGLGVAAGFGGLGTAGLVLAQVAGQALAAVHLGIAGFFGGNAPPLPARFREMVRAARTYREFPQVNTWFILADTAQYSGISFLIALYFNEASLGFYSRTFRILTVPLSFIGSALSHVFYQKAAEILAEKGDLRAFSVKTLRGSMAVALPIFLVLMLWGPGLFAFLFGAPWREAGEYARILSPWIFLRFAFAPLSQLPLLVNRQKGLLFLNVLGLALVLGALAAGGAWTGDVRWSLLLLSLGQVVFLAGMIFWAIGILPAGRRDAEPGGENGKAV